MDFSKLKRNPEAIINSLKEVGDTLVTAKPLRIYIPAFYTERGLAEIGSSTSIIGFCSFHIGDEYDFLLVPAMLNISPTLTNTVKTAEYGEYLEFYFEPGSVVMPKVYVPMEDTITYLVYTVLHSKAKVPWFIDYNTFGETFVLAGEYAGIRLDDSKDKLDVLCALQARSPTDPSVFYKDYITDLKQIETNPPHYIPISSLVHAATGTLSRLGGRDFIDGLTSALVYPHDRVEELEGVLRQ